MSQEHLEAPERGATVSRQDWPAVSNQSSSAMPPDQQGKVDADDQRVPLFSDQETTQLRARWDEIQAGFVDEPRGAVEKADGLVAEAMSKLADGFARTRSELDRQWKHGDVSTEDLRQGLRRYRSFFARLLAI
jgi:hypothetical protein